MTPTYDNPIALLRQLKGAPLSVLLALSIFKQPTSEQMLARVTGYSEKVVRDAAHYLQDISLVGRNARFSGWVLLKDVFQLPLMPGDSGQLDQASDCHQIVDRYLLPVEESITSTTTIHNVEDDSSLLMNSISSKKATGKIYRSIPVENFSHDQSSQLSIYQQNCKNLLNYHSIGYPKDIELVNLPHVTLTFLFGHISERTRQLKYCDDNNIPCKFHLGLLIHKIENNDHRPKTMIECNSYPDESREILESFEKRAHEEIINWSENGPEPYHGFSSYR